MAEGGGMMSAFYLPESIRRTPYGLIVDYCDAPQSQEAERIVKIPYDFTSRYRLLLQCESRGVMDYMADGKWRYRLNHASLPVAYWKRLYFFKICAASG